MGAVLDLLTKRHVEDVFIDLQNAEPTDNEMEVYEQVNVVLSQREMVLEAIRDYGGAQDLVREAMQNPGQETEEAAFIGLVKCVDSIKLFYDYASSLEVVFPKLLTTLSVPSEEKKHTLEDQQALAKQLAHIFSFALEFDAMRIVRPHLSNDFSYYRRLLPKFSKHPECRVKEEEANILQMFTVNHIPMINTLAKAAGEAVNDNQFVTTALACMANSCLRMIKSARFQDDAATNVLCARAMTASIVIFDHTEAVGVFKSPKIKIKECIKILKQRYPDDQALLNAIHFSTKNFNTAPSAIQSMFD